MFRDYQAVREFVSHKVFETAVLVIGDVMIDKYYYSEVTRISPEAPVPVAKVQREKATLGGSANVAHNLARFGCKTFLCGITGDDNNRAAVLDLLDELEINYDGVLKDQRHTTAKIRVVGGHQQMLRLDFEDSGAIAAAVERKLTRYFCDRVDEFQGVILSDYGKGLCTAGLCKKIISISKSKGIPVFVDPKGSSWGKYTGAYCITPNVKELGEVAGRHIDNTDKDIINAGSKIRNKYNLDNLLVTRSERGMTLIDDVNNDTLPTRAQEVFDVSGAGDTVISYFAAGICGGLSKHDASQLANYAAGIEVGKPGTYAVSNQEIAEVIREIGG